MGPSMKYVRSKGEGGAKQKRISIDFMTSLYCLKACKGGGVSNITKFVRTCGFVDDPYLRYICTFYLIKG